MTDEEKKAIELTNNFIEYFNKNIQDGNRADLTVLGEEIEAIKTILNLIESLKESNKSFKRQYNQQVLENAKIVNFYENDDLHKELYKLRKEIDEKTKSINRKNRLLKNIRDELVGDRMEEFDDYVIYLQDKYLKILDESEE